MERNFDINNNNNFDEESKKRTLPPRIIAQRVIIFVLILGLGAYGFYFNVKAEKKASELQNQYKRTFSDMTDYVKYTESYLIKAMAAGTPQMLSNMLDGVTVCATAAEGCLAALPFEQNLTQTISEYLVQLADISSSWSHRTLNEAAASENTLLTANKLTSDEYNILLQLCGYAKDLSGALNTLGENLDKNSYAWSKLPQKALDRIEKPFTDFKSLSYEGKYSSTEESHSAAAVDNSQTVPHKDCELMAIKLLAEQCNIDEQEITVTKYAANSLHSIDTYSYTLKSKDDTVGATIDIAKNGGNIYSFIINRNIKKSNLSAEQGIKAGKSFLQSLGINNMQDISYSLYQDAITVTYAYKQDDVLFYPDRISVKIALDNGTPIGFEAHNYLESHTSTREVCVPVISEDAVKKSLSPHFECENINLVVAATPYGTEYQAYECSGKIDGIPVLIYIDTETGAERDILIINETENEHTTF